MRNALFEPVMCRLRTVLLAMAACVAGNAIAMDHCDGKYAHAAVMVDAAIGKYGTLYSGGNHGRALDDIGATMDLYRLWRGLPDLRLRELHHNPDVDRWSFDPHLRQGNFESTLARNLALGTDRDPAFASPAEAWIAVVELDLATVVGDPVDWWLPAIQAPDTLSESRRSVRHLAAGDATLDWLQHAIAASDAPWALGWHLWNKEDPRRSAYARIRANALRNFVDGRGIEWAVAASLFPISVREQVAPELRAFVGTQMRQVQRCEATPAEYAALVVILYSEPAIPKQQRFATDAVVWLPPRTLEMLFRRHALNTRWWSVANPWDAAFAVDEATGSHRANAKALGFDVGEQSWAATLDTYAARSVDELIKIHAGLPWSPKSVRAFNLLPAQDLATFGRAAGLSDAQRAALQQVAFARLFALGDVRSAAALLPSLQRLLPDAADTIAAIGRLRMPEDVKHALIVASIPRWSTWLVADADARDGDYALALRHAQPRRDLLPEFVRGRAIQDDAETLWMVPQRQHRYRHMRGYSVPAIERAAFSNTRQRHAAIATPDLFHPRGTSGGIAQWAAWEELVRLAGRDRLSLRMTRVLLACVEAPPHPWFQRSDCRGDHMARGLQSLLRIARRERPAEIDGAPTGKRVFDVLHRYFPDAARKTPYWHLAEGT